MGIITLLHFAHPFVCLATLPFVLVSCYPGTFLRRVSSFWSPEHKDISLWTFAAHWLNKATKSLPHPPPPNVLFPLLFPPRWASSSILLSFFSMVHFVLCKYIQWYQEQDGSSFNAVVQNGSPKKKIKKFNHTKKNLNLKWVFFSIFCYKRFVKNFQSIWYFSQIYTIKRNIFFKNLKF